MPEYLYTLILKGGNKFRFEINTGLKKRQKDKKGEILLTLWIAQLVERGIVDS